MSATVSQRLTIAIDDERSVSALLQIPANAFTCYVLAHGAGAGMTHPFLAAIATGLAERDVATLRYQFYYMEHGSKRPDSPPLAHAAVRAAAAEASRRLPRLTIMAGGKSFGGRMTSQAQSIEPLVGVRGLAFLGFPLHPPGKPSVERASHLGDVHVPMLFLQGAKDDFAELDQLEPVIAALDSRAQLKLFADADHSFHVPARSGRKDADVRRDLLDALAAFAREL